MWKRDIHKAFRRLIIRPDHLEYAWSVFPYAGLVWAVQHLGMPFGAIASNHAWHRVGSFIRYIARKLFLVPVGRFVDDFFGASRQGVRCNGGWVISRLCKLLGFDTDEEKSEDFLGSMIVLGSRIQSIFEEGRVTSRIDEKKAQKWTILLTRILHEWKLDSE